MARSPLAGYFRFPTIHDDTVVFTSLDDLWSVPRLGGPAVRLTAGLGPFGRSLFTPDGTRLVVLGRETAQSDVYVLDDAGEGNGGPLRRLTHLGGVTSLAGFLPDGRLVFSSRSRSGLYDGLPYAVPVDGSDGPQPLPWGPLDHLVYGPAGQAVLGRHTASDPARWKRYRGGTAGVFWLRPDADARFAPMPLGPNLACPMWVGDRLYFLSDQEGIGNLYSVDAEGHDLQRHTDHDRFYARNASSDGQRIVYHAGADLYVYEPGGESHPIPVQFGGHATEAARRLVDAGSFLTDAVPHPDEPRLALVSRGQTHLLGPFDGPVIRLGRGSGERQRLARFVGDGSRVLLATDGGNPHQEHLELWDVAGAAAPTVVWDPVQYDLGHALELAVSADGARAALVNHQSEVWVVDLAGAPPVRIDHTEHGQWGFTEGFPVGWPSGLAWSPDSRYLAYACPDTSRTTSIRIWDADTGSVHAATRPVLHDFHPVWDPQGRYLYFLSRRTFKPVEDGLTFNLGFPRGVTPHLVTLRRAEPSPFVVPPALSTGPDHPPADGTSAPAGDASPVPLAIDFDGMSARVVPFPVPEGRYREMGAVGNQVLWTVAPVADTEASQWLGPAPPANAELQAFHLATGETETLASEVARLRMAQNGKSLVYQGTNHRLRWLAAGAKAPTTEGDGPGRKTGWVDLARVVVEVDPPAEWRQMLRETWRTMQREFWTHDMSGVDWAAMYQQYAALLPRIGTRGELSDLIWELVAELGTSHAYEFGGDGRVGRPEPQGTLAADYRWDAERAAWRVTHIVQGDPTEKHGDSPLNAPGVEVAEGDWLLAIDGIPLTAERPPDAALVNRADRVVAVSVDGPEGPRTPTVRVLPNEMAARYREWVNACRATVHRESAGRVGYVHIPDMGDRGFAEFHRGFLAEVGHDALVIDVRHNGGGIVSPLILAQLARRPLAWTENRYGHAIAYPYNTPRGPLVAICDEMAGSDGDIFSHNWKQLNLGPLVGTRTWGGVIGYDDTRVELLVDGTFTSQPGASFYFNDVGYQVENYGTDPTVVVLYSPDDWAAGRDPQLARAIAEALALLEATPAAHPPNMPRPRLTRPPLPPR